MGVREALVEENLYYLIKIVLKKHDYRVSGVEFRDPEPQFRMDGGRADLVLMLSDGTRLLEIECKRKIDVPYGFRAIRDFDPLGSRVINQALGYAVRIGSHAFATTNGERFALFRTPEAVKGEEEPRIKPPKKKGRKLKRKEPSAPLTRWIPLEKTE